MTAFYLFSRRILCLFALSLFLSFSISAATITWTGASSNNWEVVGNWDSGTIPTAMDDVIIPDAATTTNDPTLFNTANFATLEIQAGGILTMSSANLAGTGGITNSGTLNLTAGNNSFGSNITNNASGIINWETGGLFGTNITLNNSGNFNVRANNIASTSIQVAIVNENGGNITYDGTNNTQYLTDLTNNSGGTITVPSNYILRLEDFTNAGTVTVGGTVRMDNSTCTFNGGTFGGSGTLFINGICTIGGSATFEPEFTTITQTNGGNSLTGGGGAMIIPNGSTHTLIGTLAGFSSVTIESGATFDISNSTLNCDVTNNGTFTWSANSLFTSTSATITNNATLNLNANNVNPANVQVSFINENGGTASMASTPTFQRIGTTFDNRAGGTVSLSSGKTLAFTGNLINNGTFSGDGIAELRGLALQTLSGDGSFTNLTINNSLNVDITGTQSITGTLTFSNGRILLGGANDLTVGTISGATSARFVVTTGMGRLVQTLSGSTAFPVGPSTSLYNPVTLQGGSDQFGVRVKSTIDNAPTTSNHVNAQWDIDQISGSTATNVTLQWNSSQHNGSFDQTDCTVGRWNGAAYENHGFGASSNLGSGNFSRTTDAAVTSFSPFIVGNIDAIPPLPNTWTGASSTNWEIAANWSANLVPVSTDNVVIPDAATTANDPTLFNTGNFATLEIQAGGILTMSSANLAGTGGITNSGTIDLTNNSNTFGSNITNNASGIINWETGGLIGTNITLNNSGNFNVSANNIASTSVQVAIVNENGGNITFDGSNNSQFLTDLTNNSGGTITVPLNYTLRLDEFTNTGTVTAAGTVRMDASSCDFNGGTFGGTGTLIVNGVCTIGGSATFEPSFTTITQIGGSSLTGSNGTMSIPNGTTYTLTGTLASFSTVTIASGGTLDISNSTLNADVTNNGTFTWSANSLLSSTTPTITNNATLNLNANNINPGNVQVSFVNENGGTTNVGVAFQRIPAFDNRSGGTVNLDLNEVLAFTGTFNNDGAFTGSGEAEMRGSALQTLSGNGTFTNLSINNALNVDITGTQTVSGTLDFANGRILLGGANDLTVGTITGATNARYVVTTGTGRLVQTLSGSTVFPVGPSTSLYNPVTIQNGSDQFAVRVQTAITNATSTTSHVDAEWQIDRLSGSTAPNVTLEWNTSQHGVGFDQTNCAVARWNGAGYQNYGFGAASSSGTTRSRITDTTVPSFSPFIVANLDAIPPPANSWTGATSTNWNVATNWGNGTVPTSTDDVVIPDAATTTNDPAVSGAINFATLTVEENGILNCSGANLSGTGGITNSGTINILSGNTNIGSDITNNAAGEINWEAGALFSSSRSLTNNGDFNVRANGVSSANVQVAIVNESGGNVTVDGSSNSQFITDLTNNSGGTITVQTGNTLRLSTFTNTGTVSSAGTVRMETCTCAFNGGTFGGTGTLEMSGTNNVSGSADFEPAFATVNQTNSTLNGSGGAMTVPNGTTYNFEGSTFASFSSVTVASGGTLITTVSGIGNNGINSNIINNGTFTWSTGTLLSSTSATVTNNSTMNLDAVGVAGVNVQVLFINSASGTIERAGAGDMQLNEAFENQGTFNLGSGETARFTAALTNGGTMQGAGTYTFNNGSSIAGTGTITNMEVNASTNISVTGTQTISSQLDFTLGKISLGNNDLHVTGTLVGGNSSRYVATTGTGRLRLSANGITTFPVGPSTSSYNPVELQQSAGAADFAVRVSTGLNNANGPDIVDREWNIDNLTGTPNANVTLFWAAADESGDFDRTECRVSRFTGSGWQSFGDGAAVSSSGLFSRSATGVTSFSPFGVGSGASLPVELVNFKAIVINDSQTELTWTTASELDNRGFEVEWSLDGQDWKTIGFVEGKGTSYEQNKYRFVDERPSDGINYYRLRQLDFDGTEEYTHVLSVVLEKEGMSKVKLYPNPSENGHLNISLEGTLDENSDISIYSVQGHLLSSQKLTETAMPMDISELPAGTYLVEIRNGNQVYRERLVIQ